MTADVAVVEAAADVDRAAAVVQAAADVDRAEAADRAEAVAGPTGATIRAV